MAETKFRRASDEPPDSQGPAFQRFLESMKIDFYKWHDGIGYDLDAFNEMNRSELKQVEDLLISRKDSNWRDVEALAALNTPFAVQALRDCLQSHNLECRLFAAKFLKEMGIEDQVEEVVIQTLPDTKIGNGLTFALSLAKTYPTEAIRQCILSTALTGNDDVRVHCAAMSLFLYGKAKSDFDPNNTIIYDFHEKDLAIRMKHFIELCRLVGVNPSAILTQLQVKPGNLNQI